MAKTLANEVGKYNITVNTVLPGWTATERMMHTVKNRAEREKRTEVEVINDMSTAIPLGRVGQPEEFAAAVAFLASERASYITGVSLLVDGGWYKGLM
jgi:3-oxoacyl-[acyl-carrier protein] reductase